MHLLTRCQGDTCLARAYRGMMRVMGTRCLVSNTLEDGLGDVVMRVAKWLDGSLECEKN